MFPQSGVCALSDVSLRITAGEFVSVMGPSGSGKSTLMNILGCLDRPSKGEYLFNGRPLGPLGSNELAAFRRDAFGFIFQKYNLLGSATARENVELPAVYAGLPPRQRTARAQVLLESLGMGLRQAHLPSALSGGEQQRVAVARALMNGGQIMLADEPTGALDSKSGAEVLEVLSVLASRGHTVVLVTHDPDVATRAERHIELLDGHVVADSGPHLATETSPSSNAFGNGPAALAAPAAVREYRRWGHAIEIVRTVSGSLRANLTRTSRLRSALTVLSVTIGVWSVVAMLTILQGGYHEGIQATARTGADVIEVTNQLVVSQRRVEPVDLTMTDVWAIREQVANVRAALPNLSGMATVQHEERHLRAVVSATGSDMPIVHEWPMASGSFLTERDSDAVELVAVLGAAVRDALFPRSRTAVGEYVLIAGFPFLVKGVMSRVGTAGSFAVDRRDKQVFVPLRTGQSLLFGGTRLDSISVQIDDPSRMGETGRAIRDLLFRRHGRDGFSLQNPINLRIGFSTVEKLLSTVIAAIGVVSLFVGGMGVTTMMLASVNERTREIGIRLATGARRQDIVSQFLTEAVAIATCGGTLGILLGIASGPALAAAGLPVHFSMRFVFAALACTVGTGLVAGTVPAHRAASLDPVQALAR